MKQRVFQLIIGHVILTFGISLMIIADLGVSSWDSVYLGIKELIGGSYGVWCFVVQMIALLFSSVVLKKKPDWKALIGIILSSALVDIWFATVFKDVQVEPMSIRIVLFGLGTFLLAFGIAVYIRTNLFKAPFDELMVVTSTLAKVSYGMGRSINECIAVVIGFFLGGPIGVGTVVSALTLGLFLQLSMKLLDKGKEKGFMYS